MDAGGAEGRGEGRTAGAQSAYTSLLSFSSVHIVILYHLQPSRLPSPSSHLWTLQAAAREASLILDNPSLVGEPRLPEDLSAATVAAGVRQQPAGAVGGGGLSGAGSLGGAAAPNAAAGSAAAAAAGIYMGQ